MLASCRDRYNLWSEDICLLEGNERVCGSKITCPSTLAGPKKSFFSFLYLFRSDVYETGFGFVFLRVSSQLIVPIHCLKTLSISFTIYQPFKELLAFQIVMSFLKSC